MSSTRGGRGEMTKAPITLQDLRRRLYVKAKAEPSWRFWGLYGHVCKRETLRAAYQLAKQNDGAPGTDGVTFEAIEVDGVECFLDQLREELVERCYRPQRPRKVGIPKEGRKVRQLSGQVVGASSTAGDAAHSISSEILENSVRTYRGGPCTLSSRRQPVQQKHCATNLASMPKGKKTAGRLRTPKTVFHAFLRNVW